MRFRSKQKKLTQSQYAAKMRLEAERLIAEGKMPSLDQVLRVIAETREKYRQKILDVRKPVR
jgi:hypothetical protein